MKKLGICSCVLLLAAVLLPVRGFAAEGEIALVPVRVEEEGSPADRETRYTVELTPQTPGAPMPEDCTGGSFCLSLAGGQTGYLSIPCHTLGVFDYRLCQRPGEDPDCTYDEREYRLRLTAVITEDGSRSVSAQLFGQEDTKEAAALFRNRWAAPAYLSLTAWKTLDGNTPEDGVFSFRLLAEDGEVLHEVTNDGRRVRFPALRFDREGTFRFFLKEVAGKNKKILYDRTVYTVTVTVTKETDYQLSTVYERNGKPWKGTPSFTNYTDTGSPKTGDSVGIWFGMLGISAASLAALLIYRRKKQ